MHYYLDLYDSIKATNTEEVAPGTKGKSDDEDKFSKRKFVKVFQELAKKMYPNDPMGF